MSVCLCFKEYEKDFFEIMLQDFQGSADPTSNIEFDYNAICMREESPTDEAEILARELWFVDPVTVTELVTQTIVVAGQLTTSTSASRVDGEDGGIVVQTTESSQGATTTVGAASSDSSSNTNNNGQIVWIQCTGENCFGNTETLETATDGTTIQSNSTLLTGDGSSTTDPSNHELSQ